ncbi:hypothetical protein GCK32_009380 [Trichostrongylus colubriformis]|uniref:GOLD domain-containing protein n=1 Tax=Trichostrongylus colubriformis TaxID=6319 RepID=A0AAN8IPN0_TRICO
MEMNHYKVQSSGDLKGKFAFTADEYDIFEICISNHAPANVSLESTNSRVLYLCVFSMLCHLALAVWQVMFLRNYFEAKKLIV